MKRRSIHGLDLIRFFAALAVMLYHLGFKAWAYPDHVLHAWLAVPAAIPSWGLLVSSGWIGVQIFFVISGFVIANSANGASPFGFAAGRIRRLLPAAWICATVALLVTLGFGAPLAQTLKLWRNVMVFYPLGPWLLGQFWTLPVEIAFYTLILLLIVIDRFRWIMPVALLLAAASLVYWSALALGHAHDGHMRVTRLLLVQHGGYFALGIAMWQIWKFGRSPLRLLTVVLALAAAVVQIAAGQRMEAAGLPTGSVLVPLAIFVVSIALLWIAIRFNDRLTFLDRHAETIRLMGLSTYPLYLIHVQVGGAIMAFALPLVGGGGALIAGCLAAILASLIVAQALEPSGQRAVAAVFARIGAAIARSFGPQSRLLRHSDAITPAPLP